ncbi:MAG: hypothetical protein VKK63_12090 [Synechococcus sp.]|nr:hypothetical protein [Synechococcus sp.]
MDLVEEQAQIQELQEEREVLEVGVEHLLDLHSEDLEILLQHRHHKAIMVVLEHLQ